MELINQIKKLDMTWYWIDEGDPEGSEDEEADDILVPYDQIISQTL